MKDGKKDEDWAHELATLAEVVFEMRRHAKPLRLGDCEGCVIVPGWLWDNLERRAKALTGWRGWVC